MIFCVYLSDMNSIVEQLIESPQAFLLIQEALVVLNQEQEKRKTFYDQIDEQQKVEFINGKVIVHSLVRRKHNRISTLLFKIIDTYVIQEELGYTASENLMISLTRNDYEPDICFFNKEKSKDFTEDQTLFPAPDFIAEILSPSTADRDRGIKFEDYAAHQVKEYWIIDPEEKIVEQYLLDDSAYQLNIKAKTGSIQSVAIKNFEIPLQAIFSEKENLIFLKQLLIK